ncbi:MAG: hypothetical protein AAF490_17145 [Chloroflexota bacterium]
MMMQAINIQTPTQTIAKRPLAPKPIITYQPMQQSHRYVVANTRIDACAKNFVIISGHVQIIRNHVVIQERRAGQFIDCHPVSALRDQDTVVFAKTGCFLAELTYEQTTELKAYPPEIVVRLVTTL